MSKKKALLITQAGTSIDSATVSSLERQLERRKAYYHRFITKANSLNAQLASLKHKRELTHASENAECPLCEQLVTHKRALEGKFIAQERMAYHQLERLTKVITALKKRLIDDHAVLEAIRSCNERDVT